MNFANFLRTSFYITPPDNCCWIFLFILLFLPPGELIETSFFSIFRHVLSRLSVVMNIMNLNDLVVASWGHTFLGDITRK